MKSIRILLSTLLFALSASAATPPDPTVLNQKPLKPNSAWSYELDGKGDIWAAYYSTDGQLYLRRPDGSEVSLAPEDRPHALSGVALDTDLDRASVMWRDKASGKSLYYLPDAGNEKRDPILIDKESEPLLPFIMAHSQGEQYFLWVGERPDFKTRQQYHLYFRHTEENGRQLAPVEQVVPGIYPAWIITDKTIPVFTWANIDNQLIMAMRRFDRQAKHFEPLMKIADAPPISPYFHAFASGSRWFLLWAGHYQENNQALLLEGTYSDDQGQTWKRFAFEDLKGMNFSKIDVAADGEGHLLVAVSGRWSAEDPAAKDNVYMIRSDDNGSTWSKAYSLRMDNMRYASAQYPSVTFGTPKGTAVIIWEDWRDIRASLYAGYSQDYGASWHQVPVSLNGDRTKNFTLHYENESLLNRDGRYYVAAQRHTNDKLTSSDLVLYTFALQDLQQASQALAQNALQATEARLRERVAAYWQALQNEDYAAAYALFDPFFRAKISLESYIKNKGRIKYHEHKIETVELQNKFAKVKTSFEASVPEFKMSEQVVSRPKQWSSFTDTWLFIDGDWYREYHQKSSETRFTRY